MAYTLVDVELVVVLFTPVKFWRVEEPVTRRFGTVRRPVEVMAPVKRLVKVPVVAKRLVVVADVPVALPKMRLVKFALVPKRLVAKKLVVVALVPVAFMNVKFCSVDEPVARMLPNEPAPETVSDPSVPTDVSDELTTLPAKVVPVSNPAGALPVMLPVRLPIKLPVPLVK